MKKNYFKSLMQAAVLVCTPLVIASCDDVFGDTDNPIPAYMSIKQADINLELHADHPEKATATRTAIAATGAEIVYSSSNEKVATVDAKTGVITAVGGGDCDIIAEVTGKDSNGRNTYQPQKASFKVSVKDWRARVALKEGVEIPVFNSALAKTVEEIDLKDVLEVWPAKDTKGLTVTFTKVENTKDKGDIDPNGVIDNTALASGKVALTGSVGVANIIAEITTVPDGFEQKSFKNNQKTAALTIEVKQGVAYVSGYDAKGEAVTKYMFKDYNNEKYTNLSDVLKGSSDVTLDAGWYYLDQTLFFTHNLRIKGDVNIILGDGCSLPNVWDNDILDESAKQTYKLNIFAETKNATGTANFRNIVDFKEVNVFGSKLTTDVNKVVNVNINGGKLGTLVGTGDVNVTDGTAGYIEGFANVTLKKVAKAANPLVGNLYKIGTVTIPAGTQAGNLDNVTTATIKGTVGNLNNIETLTVEKATIGEEVRKIGVASITETEVDYIYNVKTLDLKKVTTKAPAKTVYYYPYFGNITTLNIDKDSKIGASTYTVDFGDIETANINGAEVYSYNITANALNINGGNVKAYYQIKGYKIVNKNYLIADAKVTMTDGKLTVGESLSGTEFAVRGDVEVTKGEFTASSKDYHAVSGALVGTFYGSTDNATWTKITGEERPKYITTKEPKK